MPPRKPDDFRSTRAGYVIPNEPTIQEVGPGPQGMAPSHPLSVATPSDGTSMPSQASARLPTIEVEYIQETDLTRLRESNWTLFEIWTRNRVYHVDAHMRCVAVTTRATGAPETNHSLIGSRLTGGERRSKSAQAVDLYFPVAMPGTEAVFRHDDRKKGQYGHTSTIERVVMRVRKARVGAVDSQPSWDEITGRFQTR